MAKKKAAYSVVDLEQMLERRRLDLTRLESRREKLMEDLAATDDKIADLRGTARRRGGRPPGGNAKRGAKKKKRTTKKVARRKSAKGGKRPRNQKSLRQVLMDIVPASPNPLTLDEVVDRVLETGYRSSSKNFRQVVYLNLFNLGKDGKIKKDSKTKLYSA